MKKLLALVLALVMTLGLATVGANAAYADQDDINYEEAVDVMSAIGVLAGDETGFRPTDTLKRSEGAKIVAYLMLGNKTAEAIQASGNKFTDVPANHWAAGYIEYLTSAGIIGGVGDNKFDPDGQLTGTQFAKMLLCALGYDAKIEGFGGSDWAINVQKVANQVGIFKGNSAVVGTAAVTREEAALYALNTIKSPLVEYENKGSSVAVNGATIEFGASSAKYMTSTASSTRYTAISNKLVNGTTAQIIEFAEQYYEGLKLANGGADSFGRPANVWTYKSKNIGTYADFADVVYTAEVKSGTIYKDLGLSSDIAIADATMYVNGVAAASKGIAKNAMSDAYGGNGVITEVFYTSSDNTAVITQTYVYAGEIVSTHAATATRDAYVTIAPLSDNGGPSGNFETDKTFKVDDKVLYTYSNANGVKSVQSASLIGAPVTGTLTAYTKTKTLTVGGTAYKVNFANRADVDDDYLLGVMDNDVSVYLDANGYVVYIDTEAVLSNVAVVLGRSNNTLNYEAKLLFADGTAQVVKLDGETSYDAAEDENDIVSYSMASGGKYKLTKVTDVIDAVGGDAATSITQNGKSALHSTPANAFLTGGVTASTYQLTKANGKTVFLIATKINDNTIYTAYQGIAAVPDVTTIDNSKIPVAAYGKDSAAGDVTGYATLIYIDATDSTKVTVSSTSKDVVFVKGGSSDANSHNTALGDYWVYTAVVNGEVKNDFMSDTKIAKYSLWNQVSYDSEKIAALGQGAYNGHANGSEVEADTDTYYGVGTDRVSNTVLKLGDWDVTYDKDCKVFRLDQFGNIDETAYAPSSVAKDDNDLVWFKMVNGDVTYIFIQDVPDGTNTYALLTADDPSSASVNAAATKITVDFVNQAAEGVAKDDDAAVAADNDVVKTLAGDALATAGYTVTGWTGTIAGDNMKATAKDSADNTITFDVVPTMYDKIYLNEEIVEYVVDGGASTKVTDTSVKAAGDGVGSGYIIGINGDPYAYGEADYAETGDIIGEIDTAAEVTGNVSIKTGYYAVGAIEMDDGGAATTAKFDTQTKTVDGSAFDADYIVAGKSLVLKYVATDNVDVTDTNCASFTVATATAATFAVSINGGDPAFDTTATKLTFTDGCPDFAADDYVTITIAGDKLADGVTVTFAPAEN